MEYTQVTIFFPVYPPIFGVFVAVLIIALGYYAIKFVVTLFLGG